MERARTIRQRDYRSHHSPYRHLVRAAILLDAWLLRSARPIAGRRWHFLLCSRLYIGSPTASPYLRPSRVTCVRVWVGDSADLLSILAGRSVCVCVCVWTVPVRRGTRTACERRVLTESAGVPLLARCRTGAAAAGHLHLHALLPWNALVLPRRLDMSRRRLLLTPEGSQPAKI